MGEEEEEVEEVVEEGEDRGWQFFFILTNLPCSAGRKEYRLFAKR